jgi:NOL1/NOP2/fmu family ribosome biogenesis protein
VRLWPHKVQGEGHFVAVLQRMDGGQQTTGGGRRTADGGQRTAVQPVGPSTVERNAIEAFWYPLIRLDLPERLVMVRRDGQIGEVFAVPSGAFDTAGLHVVRPGWHLGTLHLGSARPALAQGRFVPSHALAMALAANEVSQRVDEPIGSELAARYLRGETLDVPGPDGWELVTVEGFPLGWGKRSGNVIKNHYPKGLRWG